MEENGHSFLVQRGFLDLVRQRNHPQTEKEWCPAESVAHGGGDLETIKEERIHRGQAAVRTSQST